ncbi:hypothetical protein VTI74DRAFT_7488 [Chaetomium olivicolor]
MTVTRVRPKDHNHLQNIANLLGAASKIVTVTGAGNSTNAGVPDFRSKNGLYSSGYRRLFHSSVLFDPNRRRLLYRRIADMRRTAENANPTRTCHFIRALRDSSKLVQDYIQNTDCLEGKDPRAKSISAIALNDQSLRPDVLLIMRTSLATHGVQLLIRDFAKDYDAWVGDLVKRQPALHYGKDRRSIPRVLIDLREDNEQLDNRGQGSSRDNPVDLTL